jgi:hypothetical protein
MTINKPVSSRKLFTLILGLLLAVSSCQSENNVPEDSIPTPTADNQATVVSSISESPVSSTNESPVPTPIPEATPVPEPAAGKGSLTGTLIWSSGGRSFRADMAILYLGSVLESSDGASRLASLDKENDPMARADEFGRFAFLDIEPGTYVLIFSLPGYPEVVVNTLENEGDFLIVVNAGEVTQLGEFTADYPYGN